MREFRRLDWNTVGLGVGLDQLMDRAGKALATALADLPPPYVFLCGKGNNGADGFAAACHLLAAGRPATDIVVVRVDAAAPVGWPGKVYFDRLPAGRVTAWSSASAADKRCWRDGTAIDCLLGSGATGVPRPPYDRVIAWLRRHDRVVACDIPSGLAAGGSRAVRPLRTVTFHAAKVGMTSSNSGDIRVAPIGFPRRVVDVGLGDAVVGYPRPAPDGHKGDNGRVLVVGGGPFTGAPWYSGMAAYRAGADLARVVAPADAAAIIATWGPEPMVSAAGSGPALLPEHVGAVVGHLDHADALVLGPGLGAAPDTVVAARDVALAAAKRGIPTVLDADGLLAIDVDVTAAFAAGHLILTPHGGEFRRLAGVAPGPAAAKRYAARHGVTVVLKGVVDTVTDGEALRRCRLGHPTMTVGGTGDVLAGVIGALLAKGARGMDAAGAALYLVNEAGSLAGGLRSYGATAQDVLDAVPAVLARLE